MALPKNLIDDSIVPCPIGAATSQVTLEGLAFKGSAGQRFQCTGDAISDRMLTNFLVLSLGMTGKDDPEHAELSLGWPTLWATNDFFEGMAATRLEFLHRLVEFRSHLRIRH